MSDRDEEILRHIGLYRLTLRLALTAAFDLPNPGNVLARLRADGLIVERRGAAGLPGNVSYYQLTASGAADRVSLERAKPLRGPGLRQHLAVLWFCHLDGRPRARLEESEVASLFEGRAPSSRQAAFCVETEGETRRLLRVLVPGDAVPARRVVKAVRTVLDALTGFGTEVAQWIAARSLGVVVLVDTPERARVVREAVRGGGMLSSAHVQVHAVPSPRSLPRFLADIRAYSDSASHSGPSRS